MKKNCVVTRKINGNISYNKDGPFKNVKTKGVAKVVSLFFKKFDSSIKLIIKTNIKNIIEIKNNFFENFLNKYFLYVFIKLISPKVTIAQI